MMDKIEIPVDALQFIILQRTSHTKVIEDDFIDAIANEYGCMKNFLPAECSAILDIGCGVGGIDIMLYHHYHGAVNLYLLDRTYIPAGRLKYRFGGGHEFYNSFDATKSLLSMNDVAPIHMNFVNAADDFSIDIGDDIRFDLVISSVAWGFHFPVSTYLDQVYDLMNPGGHLIMDVRKGTDGCDVLEERFGKLTQVEERRKRTRILAIK